jgi:hypothetical protein
MHLRDLLDEVATAHEPPSRLTADDVYTAGKRRRRTTAVARLGTAAALGVSLVAALVVTAPTRGPDEAVEPDRADPPATVQLRAIGGYDEQRLYAIVLPCANWDCDPELRTTSDGGRSWTTRGTIADVNLPGTPWEIHVSRSGAIGVFGYRADGARVLSTSIDRGRSFAQVTPDGPVDAAARDALVTCAYEPSTDRCAVQVNDLDAGTAGPLAGQPTLVVLNVRRAPDGTIWALGRDDGAKRPAIARSTDGGRTWTTHVFADAPELTAGHRLLNGRATAVDGTVVVELTYALLADPDPHHNVAYRLRDGAWQRLDTGVFDGRAMVGASYVEPDGTLVLQETARTGPAMWQTSPPTTPWSSGGPPWSSGPPQRQPGGPAAPGTRYWSCSPGGTAYRRIEPPRGLTTEQLADVVRLPGGGYLARTFAGAWVSDDGRAWKRVAIP